MSAPLVSILTPSLNQAAHVEDCLASVRSQDHGEIEQVIVDGGSTDGTLETIRRYEGERCRLLVREGTSQAEALNIALAESRGELIGWLNTDDAYFSVDAVSTAVRRFAASPECLGVYGDAVVADERGRVLRHVCTSARSLLPVAFTSPVVQPSVFLRRLALGDRLVREDLHLMLDYELWLRLAGQGSLCKVGRILAIDRDYPGRKIRGSLERQRAEVRLLTEEYGAGLESPHPARRAASAWLRRARGVRELLTFERNYRLSFACEVDARWRRAVRQLLLPQRFLHVG